MHTTKLWGCQVKLRNDSFTRFFLPKMEIGSNFVVLCNFLEQQTGFAQRVYRCFVYCMDHRCFVLGPIHSRYILDDWTRCESCNGSTRFGTGSPRFNDNPKPGWYPISHMFFFLVPTCFHPKFLIQIDHFFSAQVPGVSPTWSHQLPMDRGVFASSPRGARAAVSQTSAVPAVQVGAVYPAMKPSCRCPTASD